MEDADLVMGWTGEPEAGVEHGIAGVKLPIGWLDGQGHVTIKVLFIPPPFISLLSNSVAKLSDPEIARLLDQPSSDE